MSGAVKDRNGLEIITEMLALTREMSYKTDDADFLLASIERREQLMQEYDAVTSATLYAKEDAGRDKPEIKHMIDEIIELDKTINASLLSMRNEAKQQVTSSNIQKKVLNYTNQAISSSGSYMDFKQ